MQRTLGDCHFNLVIIIARILSKMSVLFQFLETKSDKVAQTNYEYIINKIISLFSQFVLLKRKFGRYIIAKVQ